MKSWLNLLKTQIGSFTYPKYNANGCLQTMAKLP